MSLKLEDGALPGARSHETAELVATLREMRTVVAPAEDPELRHARRARTLGTIEGAIRAVPARRRRAKLFGWARRGTWALGAAALLALAYVSLWRHAGYLRESAAVERRDQGIEGGTPIPVERREEGSGRPPDRASARPTPAFVRSLSGSVLLRRGGTTALVSGGRRDLEPGDSVSTTRESSAEIQLSEHARVEVSPSSELELRRANRLDEELELFEGRIDLEVPTRAGERRQLLVRTASADVSVTGTRFSVAVVRGSDVEPSATRVTVDRGAVLVTESGKSGKRVTAGEVWSSRGRSEPAAVPSTRAGQAPRATAGARVLPVGGDRRGTLAVQNELLRLVLAARNRGDHAQALKLADDFLARYPKSALAQTVRLERARAAQGMLKGAAE